MKTEYTVGEKAGVAILMIIFAAFLVALMFLIPSHYTNIDTQAKERLEASWPYRHGLIEKPTGQQAAMADGVESTTKFVPCTASEDGKPQPACKFSGGKLSNKGLFVTVGMGTISALSFIGAIVLGIVTAPSKVPSKVA